MAFDEDGEPYEIHGCDYCLPWHAEVHIDDDGNVFVREWHAVECEAFEELINDDLLRGPRSPGPSHYLRISYEVRLPYYALTT